MDEDGQPLHPQRSLSQTSANSNISGRVKTARTRSRKSGSGSSNPTPTATTEEDKSLTSFPSLSPECSPYARCNAANDREGFSKPEVNTKQAKASLAILTRNSPSFTGRAALFDDSPSASHDVPGAIHYASDEHIKRLMAKIGAVNLVRQFARDLAHRDAEITALRTRATEREKELKRMLREVEVSNMDIEMRLYNLEKSAERKQEYAGEDGVFRPGLAKRPTASIDDMVSQAMLDDVGINEQPLDGIASSEDLQATIRPNVLKGSDTRSANSNADRRGSVRSFGEYFWGSAAASKRSSRSSSVVSNAGDAGVDTTRLKAGTSSRRTVLDDSLFQPPNQGAPNVGIPSRKAAALNGEDDSDAQSRKSSKSISAWTVKLFAGNQGGTSNGSRKSRSRAASLVQNKPRDSRASSIKSSNTTHSAMASLAKVQSHTVSPLKAVNPGTNSTSSQLNRPNSPHNLTPSLVNASLDATNYGPVEMDQILPMHARPPTLIHTYSGYDPTEVLTDRFGFIYDQRRKKRQREATAVPIKRLSLAEPVGRVINDQAPQLSRDMDSLKSGPPRPLTPVSLNEEKETTKRWTDFLRIATRPTELLSHTPSVGPILAFTTGDYDDTGTRQRSSTISVPKEGSRADPQTSVSTVTAGSSELAGTTGDPNSPNLQVAEQEPVKLLLEHLTELHDSLQREKTVKWNEFLRKVRAERRREGETLLIGRDRSSKNLTPEASLADGEIIGISDLGNKGKVGRAKWKEFRHLVLGGIPVSLRPKIWAECSGASALRVPGYYDDLVNNASNDPIDPSVVSQIQMDINRTLTDNVFFRKGPGVSKLREVLLAYACRNPVVGYCQGMNLITASLLLIMPTSEDAFWILASIVENILPAHYYDGALLACRADQRVLRQYVTEILPRLSAHLDELEVELEALTFQWFLSIFTDCLSAEVLYRVWDVLLCLNAPPPAANQSISSSASSSLHNPNPKTPSSPTSTSSTAAPLPTPITDHENQGSTAFLHAVALALLKLNEPQLLAADTPALLYSYINHDMTNHAISIDGLINASEALGRVIRMEEVRERRMKVMAEMAGGVND